MCERLEQGDSVTGISVKREGGETVAWEDIKGSGALKRMRKGGREWTVNWM